MDKKFETTAVKVIGTAAVIFCASTAMAQEAKPDGQSTKANTQSAQPRAETSIFGSTALPKGLTIVPWKSTKAGQVSSSPIRQVEEPLKPIDPSEFHRRLKYYQQSGGK